MHSVQNRPYMKFPFSQGYIASNQSDLVQKLLFKKQMKTYLAKVKKGIEDERAEWKFK